MSTAVKIVFLHGIGGGATGFAPHIAWFAKRGVEAIAWNQPGYGGKPLIEPYTFDAVALTLANDLRQHSDAHTKWLVVGHSMGGMIAQLLALQTQAPNNNLVAGLVLAHTSAAFGNQTGDFQKQFVADRVAPLDAGKTMADVARRLVPSMVGPSCPDAVRKACVDLMSAVPSITYRAALAALVQFDVRARLSEISMPVLCLGAEHDKTAPSTVLEKLATKLPNARFANLMGLGHLAPMEDCDAFCNVINDFYNEL